MLLQYFFKKFISLVFIFSLSFGILFAQETNKMEEKSASAAIQLQVLNDYLSAFNAGDLDKLQKFAAEHLSEKTRQGMTPERIAQMEIDFHKMLGSDFDVYKINANSNSEMVATLRTRNEFPIYGRLKWKFDSTNQLLITDRDLYRIPTPEEALPPKESAEELAKNLDSKLTKLTAEDNFSGVVLIAKDGKPVWQKAYGYADREAKIPNNFDTRFRLGSMNKMFTSVAVAKLVQDGKLKYSDTIAELLPDYPNKDAAQKINVHQLLTHTSGLGDIFGPEFDQKKDSLKEIKDYLPLFVNKPLRFEPGTNWSYSNAGFIVLGLIIEKLSGQSYYDFVQKNIYDVAGMKNSGSFPKTEKIPNLAVGYMKEKPDAAWTPNWNTLPWRGMSAGGDSTIGDLLRFSEALRKNKLLNAELTNTVVSGKVSPGEGTSAKYAYGFEEKQIVGHRIVGHSGGAPGMNGELDIYLDNDYTVVVLSNLSPPIAQQVSVYIQERLK